MNNVASKLYEICQGFKYPHFNPFFAGHTSVAGLPRLLQLFKQQLQKKQKIRVLMSCKSCKSYQDNV